MIIKMYLSHGEVVVYDTDHMTDSRPSAGSLLTNYSLRLDANGECLWLASFRYEAPGPHRDELGPIGLPMARRQDGWSFLLADADDMAHMSRLTVDGETVLIRLAGDLVDATALDCAYDALEDYGPKAVSAHARLISGMALSDGDIEETACAMLGMSPETYRKVENLEISK